LAEGKNRSGFIWLCFWFWFVISFYNIIL
jgi:hypothetical protein